MDLKLRDEITKLLIASPGMSISELAKKTKNYYSYTHKVVSEMEKKGLINVKKVMRGNRGITICSIASDYKLAWVSDLRRVVKSLLKDAEVKAAFVLIASLFVLTLFTLMPQPTAYRVASTEAIGLNDSTPAEPPAEPLITTQSIILVAATVLIIIWLLRNRKKWY